MKCIRLIRQKQVTCFASLSCKNLTYEFTGNLIAQRLPTCTKLDRRSYSSNAANCWNCAEFIPVCSGLFCGNCGKLLEARTHNYFQLMSVDEKFDLNIADLTKRYRELQVMVHPDKYWNRDEKERQNSMEWSALLNKAYRILSEPVERGEYILNQKGVVLPYDNSALDQDFLQEIMEKNEEIENSDLNSIHIYLANVRTTLYLLSESFADMLNTRNYDEAKSFLVKMKYYKSLEKTIKERIDKMGLHLP